MILLCPSSSCYAHWAMLLSTTNLCAYLCWLWQWCCILLANKPLVSGTMLLIVNTAKQYNQCVYLSLFWPFQPSQEQSTWKVWSWIVSCLVEDLFQHWHILSKSEQLKLGHFKLEVLHQTCHCAHWQIIWFKVSWKKHFSWSKSLESSRQCHS